MKAKNHCKVKKRSRPPLYIVRRAKACLSRKRHFVRQEILREIERTAGRRCPNKPVRKPWANQKDFGLKMEAGQNNRNLALRTA